MHDVTFQLQASGCPERGLMLSRPRHQGSAGWEPASSTKHGQVHGFRTAGAEDDVASRDTQRSRGEIAGGVDSRASGAALSVQARRVSVGRPLAGTAGGGQDGSAAGVVQVQPRGRACRRLLARALSFDLRTAA